MLCKFTLPPLILSRHRCRPRANILRCQSLGQNSLGRQLLATDMTPTRYSSTFEQIASINFIVRPPKWVFLYTCLRTLLRTCSTQLLSRCFIYCTAGMLSIENTCRAFKDLLVLNFADGEDLICLKCYLP